MKTEALKTASLLRVLRNWRVDTIGASDPVERTPSGLLVPASVIRSESGHNLVTTAGLAWVLSRINSNAANAIGYLARGSSSTAASIGQTALITETERDAVTSAVLSTTQLVFQYLEPATANNGQTFREAGLFDAASSGTMFNRWVHTDIVKSSSIQILYSITITVEEA